MSASTQGKWVVGFMVLATAAVSQAGFAGGFDNIIGGEDVVASDPIAASTVAVRGKSPTSGKPYLCTGSVIADDLVLTAGHCLESAATDMEILFGPDSKNPIAKRKVKAHKRPDNYSASGRDRHDIAVLSFTGGIPEGFAAVEILDSDRALKRGTSVVLAGYGMNVSYASPGMPSGSGFLRKVGVKVANPLYGESEIELDESGGKGSCKGDSGGPALIQDGGTYYVFGVTSRGPYPCRDTGVYTNVVRHAEFIQNASDLVRR